MREYGSKPKVIDVYGSVSLAATEMQATSTSTVAEQVLSASGELSEQAETLRLKVETFLNAVKAA